MWGNFIESFLCGQQGMPEGFAISISFGSDFMVAEVYGSQRGEFGKGCFCSVTLFQPLPQFSLCFGLVYFPSLVLHSAVACGWWWLVSCVTIIFWDVWKLSQVRRRNWCFVCCSVRDQFSLYLRFSLTSTVPVLGVVKKGLCHYSSPALPQHSSQPCPSFGELLLWLLAKLAIFLLPLLDKHHVQQQINEWSSAVARGSGTRTPR